MFGYANFCWLCKSFPSIHLHQLHMYVNDFVHVLPWKSRLFLVWMVFCAIFVECCFTKGINEPGGEILIALKWKQELEFNIFLLMHSISFILESSLVCWLRTLWKFLLCYCRKTLLTSLFSFGGVNNV
jgi:hypothetical protein